MDEESIKTIAAKITAVVLVLVVLGFYLFPWLMPLFYDMPEGMTLPYYAILVAIDMSPFVHSFKSDQREKLITS